MKTIEERAKECSYKIYTSGVEWWRDSNSMIEFGQLCYKKGAKEQKAIDNEKAKIAFSKACGWLSTYPWYNEVFEGFIKNMEE